MSHIVQGNPTDTSSQIMNRDLQRHQENRDIQKIAMKFLAGGSTTALISGVMNSCDHIKTRLQITNKMANPRYFSFGQAYVLVFREEGLKVLLTRGLGASVTREMFYSSIRLGLYDPVKAFYTRNGQKDGIITKILAGATSGAIGSSIACK
jgi:solute carrier family 25 uncoupling protein 8/9